MTPDQRLLIIDDEPHFAEFVRKVAEDLGFTVKVTTESADFIASYESFRPTVITLDMVMPGRDGLSMIEWLMRAGCTARIVIISGFNPGHAALAVMEGARHRVPITSLSKPVSVATLRATLLARNGSAAR
jgi:CheY-like chemotaxis protein